MAIDSLSKYRNAVDGQMNKLPVGENDELKERMPVRRGNGWRLDPLIILEEEDFNVRGAFAVDYWNRPDVVAYIRGFAKSYKEGKPVPPIAVEVRDGEIYVRDGAHRLRGMRLALKEGADLELVDVVEHQGDEVEQAKLVLTANDGRHLTRLERAVQYGKFIGWGWSMNKIASEFNKTHEHVRSTLTLLNLPFELKQMIAEEICSASFALKVYDEHGTKALEIIKGAASQKTEEQEEEDKALALQLDSVVNGLSEGLGNDKQGSNEEPGSKPDAPTEPPEATTPPPRKPRVTGKDLPKTGVKISRKTVQFVHKSFESLQKSIDSISRENDYFVMKLNADEVELLKQMKSQLAASGASVDPQQPVKDPSQTDLVEQLDGQQQAATSAQ